MLVVHKKINVKIDHLFHSKYELKDYLFFDIETTGFSPYNTILYLIGCIYQKKDGWYLTQWFADNNTSEEKMLIEFFELTKHYKALVHFNGEGFDMPYLLKKCDKFHLNYNFDEIESFDIYKKISPYKKILKTENLKQKTIEQFLDINRYDKLSGGELIKVYGEYLKLKTQQNQASDVNYELLLLHNEDDLKGMLNILPILHYSHFFEKPFTIKKCYLKTDQLVILFRVENPLPKRISYGKDTIYLTANEHNAMLTVGLYKYELKYFYQNYKDYYYLPQEDVAIHKSVAFYVDKDFRTKAKAANCYSKKTGSFVPQFAEIITPYFKIDYFDKITYFETTDDIIQNNELMSIYVKHLIDYLLKRKP